MTHAKQSPRQWGTRLGLPLVVLAVLVVAAFALVLSRPSGDTPLHTLLPPQFLSPLRTDATPIHVRLSGRDYYVPANYFDGPLEPGIDQVDILLVALLPNLEARTQDTWDEFMRVPGFGRRVYMLIRSEPFPADILERYFQTDHRNFGPLDNLGEYYGLRHSRSIGDRNSPRRRDVFIYLVDDSLNGIITCSFEEDYPFPACEHQFIHRDLMVKLVYGRSNLTQWESIKASVGALLDGFARADGDM